MASVSTRFFEIACNVTNEISRILEAPVIVTDDRGIIISSSELFETKFVLNERNNARSTFLRLPIQFQAEAGEILVGDPLNQEFVSPRIAQILVELVINQTTRQQEQTVSKNQLKNQLIRSLVQGQIRDEEIALRQARQLGVDLVPPRAVILIDAASYVFKWSDSQTQISLSEREHRIKGIIRSIVSFFHLPNDTICADLGQGMVCVLKASDTKNLGFWAECTNDPKGLGASWANLVALRRAADALLMRLRSETNASIDIGIGRYHPGVSGLARSYEDAQVALSLGSRFKGHNQVHCLGELGVAAFVGISDEATKVELAKYLLSPLDHESELVTTLDIFFAEDCCPSSTAKRLSIHRNTLSYRLDKIFSLTGLEPRKFDDAVQMRLCLLLRSLQSPQT